MRSPVRLSLPLIVLFGCAFASGRLETAPIILSAPAAPYGFALVQGVPSLTWPMAIGVATAQGYTYKAYFTAAGLPASPTDPTSLLTALSCVAASGGGATCSGTIATMPPDGKYDIRVSSSKTVGSTTKESSKSAALTNQDLISPPPTPGQPSSCTGCAPSPAPPPAPVMAWVAPATGATLTGVADVTFETTDPVVVRAEAWVVDAGNQLVCTCEAIKIGGAVPGSQRWQVQLDTPKAANAVYGLGARGLDVSGTIVASLPVKLVPFAN